MPEQKQRAESGTVMVVCVEEILGKKTLFVVDSEGMPQKSGVFLSGIAAMYMPRDKNYRGEQKLSFLGCSRREHSFSVDYKDVAPIANAGDIFINHSHGLVRCVNLGGIKQIKVSMLGKHGDYIDAVVERLTVLIYEQEQIHQQIIREQAAAILQEQQEVNRAVASPIQQELTLSSPIQSGDVIVSEESLPIVSEDSNGTSMQEQVLSLLREVSEQVSELRQMARSSNPLKAKAQWFSTLSLAETFEFDYQEAVKLVREIGEGLIRERNYAMDVRYGAPTEQDSAPMFVSQRLARHIVTIIERKHIKVKIGYVRP